MLYFYLISLQLSNLLKRQKLTMLNSQSANINSIKRQQIDSYIDLIDNLNDKNSNNYTTIESKYNEQSSKKKTNKFQFVSSDQQEIDNGNAYKGNKNPESSETILSKKKKVSKILLKKNDQINDINTNKNYFGGLDENESKDQLVIMHRDSSEKTNADKNSIQIFQRKRRSVKLAPFSTIIKNKDTGAIDSDTFKNIKEKSPKKRQIKAIRSSDLENTHQFIKVHIPKNKRLYAVLKRDKGGLKRLFPQYDLYLNQDLRYIMSSKRKPCFCTSTYHLGSRVEPVTDLDEEYVGTLNSNFLGNVWNVYDDSFDAGNELVATIYYDNQITFQFTPRHIQVYLVSPYYSLSDVTGSSQNKNLKQLYDIGENKQNKRILKLVNKKPEYYKEKSVWIMDFRGKAPVSSVKNMILVDASDEKREVMLLTKARDHAFNFEITFPLSPRIGMAIANTSFDFKWTCQ